MANVAITGGTGSVGKEAIEALSDHETTVMARSEHETVNVVELDVTDRDRFVEVLDGQDVLVHLAANSSPFADWDEVVEPNIEGTYNAYHAALECDLDRVVFASTNHVVHMYNAADPSEPESLINRPRPVTSSEPARPDSYYGVSKVAGEALGAYTADRFGLEVINLRIGWLMTEAELETTQEESADHARFARAMYLSPRDCRDAIYRSITEPIDESPLTCQIISLNDERYFSLIEATTGLGYRPRDNSSDVLAERAN
ncbi:NAD-dependent epimerase/dehydratase family protein [Halovivax gelatinilyticus]|uniref:NAD-dependent epimerase/dehydratase family protein n=1 Tax=Halovivax gelatinilyticus TaxID=2961597 RepID=UPI0020CA9BB0|nr:NAD(P)-dependent oxidoreductase [Halovivax gelatinilyticus]